MDASDIWIKKPAWSMLSVKGAVNTIGAPVDWFMRLPPVDDGALLEADGGDEPGDAGPKRRRC